MIFKNDKAVSPVVATLVLIVVAIIGAAAVGLLLGAFSSGVQSQASSSDTSKATSTEMIIGGSTTVQPLSEELAKAYMAKHQGIKITVQAGGSGAGRMGVENGVLDIGSASSKTDTTVAPYDDLKETEIGGSAVVLIGNGITNADPTSGLSATEVNTLYSGLTAGHPTAALTGAAIVGTTAVVIPTATSVYQRSDISGTEDCFANAINYHAKNDGINDQLPDACTALPATSNGDMYAKIAAATTTAPAVGFCDFGYVKDANLIIGLGCTKAEVTEANILTSLKSMHNGGKTTASNFPVSMCRSLYYLTKGEPSALEGAFIKYSTSPESIPVFEAAHYYSTYKYY